MKIQVLVILVTILLNSFLLSQNVESTKYGVFSFEKELTLPGTPEEIFDAATGDISGWWDHSFSENPKKFYIEPKPGGGFREIFDEEGNGVLHATVIAADRGKLLRFDGPLGLAGTAIQIVTTYTFEPVEEDSTLMRISVHASGEMNDKTAGLVESVWEHFIFGQFKAYVEGRAKLRE
ncbi:MAG: SRPBCC domain-containing protein [Ignavibacteria bacterium]|jgi:uncharacterized protein YndB with AHSA1/START domain